MHVMDSVCRDAMIRHASDKIELNSQDEEEDETVIPRGDEGDSDAIVVVEPKDVTTTASAAATTTPELKPESNSDAVKSVEAKVNDRRESSSATTTTTSDEVKVQPEEVNKVMCDESELLAVTVASKDISESTCEGGEVIPQVAAVVALVEKSNDCDKPKGGGVENKDKKAKDNETCVSVDEIVVGMEVDNQLPNKSDKVLNNGDQKEEMAATTVKEVMVKNDQKDSQISLTKSTATELDKMVNNDTETSRITTKGSEPAVVENGGESKESTEAVLKRKRSTSSTETEMVVEKAPTVSAEKSTAPTDSSSTSTLSEPSSKKPKLSETAAEMLQRELNENFGRHDKLLHEYITKATMSSSSADGAGDNTIQKHVDQLVMEIEALNDMIRTKELEWNNMIHLKKVKEELVMRLTRKKHVEDLVAAPLERTVAQASVAVTPEAMMTSSATGVSSIFSGSGASSKAAAQANKLIKNLQLSASTLSGAAANSKTTQSILQNRANMTSEDLEKEKKNTAKLHR